MRLYFEVARASYRRYRAYGAANIAGLITNAFFGLLRSYLFIALYQARPVVEDFRLHDAITFVWVSQALIMPVMLWGWMEIALTVQSGDVATDLSKPFSYFGYWLARDYGRAVYHILFRTLPTLLMGIVLFDIRLPARPETWVLFPLSLVLAITIGFCFRFLVNISAFWITDVRGVGGLAMFVINFFSGFLVPLEFFPPALRAVSEALPFAGMIAIPYRIFLEHEQGTSALVLLGRQLLWVAVMVLVSRLALRTATRKLVVQGG